MPKDPNRRQVIVGGAALALGGMMATSSSAASFLAGRKVLVAYYSRTGHTRAVAEKIHAQTGGDLVEIQTVTPYTDDYDALVAQNAEEQRTGFLPPLSTRIEDIAEYDIVFIGSPLWNVRLTPPVRSFLSSYDFAGRTIAPFVTYIVSGLGRAREDIGAIAPQARITEGLAVLGEGAEQADQAITQWLNTVATN